MGHGVGGVCDEVPRAELAEVVEAERRAVIEVQAGAFEAVGGGLDGRVHEGAGHTEVQDPGAPIVEVGDEVLAVARQPLDGAAGEFRFERARAVRDREALAARVDAHSLDAAPDEEGREVAADGLDLGEFWHGVRLAGGGGRCRPRDQRVGGARPD